MAELTSIDEQVRANFPEVERSSEFVGNKLWLTFYLSGPPSDLWLLSDVLGAEGWTNLDGWDGSTIYAKLQSEKSAEAVVRVSQAAEQLCDQYNVQILIIDADTSPDVERSHFVTLYRSPS